MADRIEQTSNPVAPSSTGRIDNAVMRSVGRPSQALIPSPQEAWELGLRLDAACLPIAAARPKGMWRLSHAAANLMDEALMLHAAARLQSLQTQPRHGG